MAKAKTPEPAQGKPPTKKRRRRKPRGALAAICALLVTSGLLRMAIGASEALAREGGDDPRPALEAGQAGTDPKPASQLAKGASGDGHAPAGTAPQVRVVAEADIQPLLKALDAREARIAKRESAIEVRMQALAVAEEEIERKMQALAAAEASLKETLTLARTAATDDIDKLTEVYAKMKPKHAAALFQEMDPEFAAGFLARMRPEAAAAIMAGMSPQSAYLISVILAGRNADVPTE